MYPPQPLQYSRISEDPDNDVLGSGDTEEDGLLSVDDSGPLSLGPRPKRPWLNGALKIIAGVSLLLIVATISWAVSIQWRSRMSHEPGDDSTPSFIPDTVFSFSETRPSWLTEPSNSTTRKPLIIRLAIMTRADAFERRQTLRSSVLENLPDEDVQIVYKFFVGLSEEGKSSAEQDVQFMHEMRKYGDIIMLSDTMDIPDRISEKRYSALRWGGSVPKDTYDYFMTMDSDTFCRFSALARRLPILYQGQENPITNNPREQPILLGRMGALMYYFQNTVPDGNKDPHDEDQVLKGPWYNYPVGIGYMISSALTDILLSTNPPLPHHIHYPGDDVMIGAWVAALRNFPDKTIKFETSPDHTHKPAEPVVPTPFLPYVVNTTIVNDNHGWHDFPERGLQEGLITYDSVCVHRLVAEEMRVMRHKEEFMGEWVDPKSGRVYDH